MKKTKINQHRATVVISAVLGLLIAILVVFVYGPLVSKINLMRREFWTIKQEVKLIRNMLEMNDASQTSSLLLAPEEISLAIDEMTQVGGACNINFTAISSQETENAENIPYERLSILMEMESRYKDLGIFLSALDELKESIVTVKGFNVWRDEDILPLVRSQLVVDVYLKDHEDGQE